MGVIETFPYGRTPPILRSSAESLASSTFNSSIPPTPPSEVEEDALPAHSSPRNTRHLRRRDPTLLLQRLEQISRRRVGSQKARRENNALILQTLVEDVEDSYKCPSIDDFIPNTESAFSKLMKDSESMKVWQYFIAQSEADQLKYLADVTEKSEKNSIHFDLGIYFAQTNGNKILQNASEKTASLSPNTSPTQRFNLIARNFKNVLKKASLPLGMIGHLEEDVVGVFTDDSNAVYVSPELNNFHRLLLHGISQYYFLHSKSLNLGGGRRTKVENKYNDFSPPKLSLTNYLKQRQT